MYAYGMEGVRSVVKGYKRNGARVLYFHTCTSSGATVERFGKGEKKLIFVKKEQRKRNVIVEPRGAREWQGGKMAEVYCSGKVESEEGQVTIEKTDERVTNDDCPQVIFLERPRCKTKETAIGKSP